MNGEEQRNKFYEEVRTRTGLSDEEIKEFLSKKYDKYEPAKEKEYMEYLTLWGSLQHRIRTMVKMQVLQVCPVCQEATGYERDWGWICTKGGMRHRIVAMVSSISGVPAETLLANLEEFDADKDRLVEATRKAEERSEVRFQSELQRQTLYKASHPELADYFSQEP